MDNTLIKINAGGSNTVEDISNLKREKKRNEKRFQYYLNNAA